MKLILLILLLGSAVTAQSQFHLKITCNPDHNGQINPMWANNYVITYTNDNWKHSHLLNWQVTYQGFDNDGIIFYTSYWQPCTFQGQQYAFEVAHKLTSQYAVGNFLTSEYQKHLNLKAKYDKIIETLSFGESKPQNCPKEIVIK